MTAPEINRELFQQILDQIREHPETHNQLSYESTNSGCGTTRCVAGWAIHFQGGQKGYAGEVEQIAWNLGYGAEETPMQACGADLLGLTEDEARYLFLETGDAEALDLVEKYALKGREWQ